MVDIKKKNKATIIVMSGDYDKLFGAYVLATSAAASNMEVVMFYTFWGLRALKKNVRTGKSFMGKMIGLLEGGDINKASPSKYSLGGAGRWMFKKMMASKNVATLPELRQMALDLGVKMYGCQMTMDIMEITRESLIDEVEDFVGGGFAIQQAQESSIQLFI